MKIKDADILLVPGEPDLTGGLWLNRWAEKISSARTVDMADLQNPDRDAWTARVVAAVNQSTKPIVLAGHSAGVAAIVNAAPLFDASANVRGAYLVAPPVMETSFHEPFAKSGFGPYPTEPLPFPSFLVHATNDQHMTQEDAQALANSWGSLFIDARDQGHIDVASGHGPWPEGLMVFSKFLSRL
ncbi:MAG: alpha/beta hydrolase [Pseudomonadota bacterium]